MIHVEVLGQASVAHAMRCGCGRVAANQAVHGPWCNQTRAARQLTANDTEIPARGGSTCWQAAQHIPQKGKPIQRDVSDLQPRFPRADVQAQQFLAGHQLVVHDLKNFALAESALRGQRRSPRRRRPHAPWEADSSHPQSRPGGCRRGYPRQARSRGRMRSKSARAAERSLAGPGLGLRSAQSARLRVSPGCNGLVVGAPAPVCADSVTGPFERCPAPIDDGQRADVNHLGYVMREAGVDHIARAHDRGGFMRGPTTSS